LVLCNSGTNFLRSLSQLLFKRIYKQRFSSVKS